jgi:uncharacterized protein YkwD
MKNVRNCFIPHKDNDFKPHIFTEAGALILVLISVLLFASSFTTSTLVKRSSQFAGVYASVLVDLTNSARVKNELPPLTKNPLLESAAVLKANDMVANNYFAHTSPLGVTPWDWLVEVGYDFLYAGENLAEGFRESADINRGWLTSPSHKANIVSPHFTEIGIAVVEGNYKGSSTIFVVEYFGQPQAVSLLTPAVGEPVVSTATAPLATVPSKVLGASSEKVTVDILTEDDFFIEVKNLLGESTGSGVTLDTESVPKYSTWAERFIVHEPTLIQILFTVIAIVVLTSLILFISIEFRSHHRRYAFYGVGMVGLLILLLIMNHSLIMLP